MSCESKRTCAFVLKLFWDILTQLYHHLRHLPSCISIRCLFSRLDIVSIRSLSVRHQLGGSFVVVDNGQPLFPAMYHVKLKGKRAQIRIRLPAYFWDGITQETEGKMLAVLILDKKCKTSNGANITETDDDDDSMAEVGKYRQSKEKFSETSPRSVRSTDFGSV